MEADMAHFVTADRDHDGSALKGRNIPHRFGSVQNRHGRSRGRSALNRVNGYLKTMIEKIADAKVRRMKRELELLGIHFDPANETAGTERRRQRTDAE
jgi:hypothetical protein